MRKYQVKERCFSGTADPMPRSYELAHGELSRRAAAEGFVLLKNEDSLLPLEKGSRLALFGAGAVKTVKGGIGSGDVNERRSISIWEGLKNAGAVITSEEWLCEYERIYNAARLEWRDAVLAKIPEGSGGFEFFNAYSTTAFSVPAGPSPEKAEADAAIFVLGRVAGEGADRLAAPGDYYLNEEEHGLLSEICTLYKNVVVLINTGGVVDLSFMDEFPNIKALMVISQPGMEAGNAVADVLFGEQPPGGRLTDTWAFRYEDYPAAARFSHNNGDTEKERYEEDIFVGYRWFDTFGIPVRYSFGEGLSYTGFEVSADAPLIGADGAVTLPVTVRNSGGRAGREVVQVYISLPHGRLEKEHRRLCAFGKTGQLEPGESETLALRFTPFELTSFDEAACAWVLEKGDYLICVGVSLAGAAPKAILRLHEDKTLLKLRHICPLKEELHTVVCPKERREELRRMEEKLAGTLAVYPYDLSAVEPTEVEYSDNEPDDDEAALLVRDLSVEQLIALASGDPAKEQGCTLGAAGIAIPGSAGETSSCAIEQKVANITLADGPAGLRLTQVYYTADGKILPTSVTSAMEHGFFNTDPEPDGERHYQFCTAFPVGTILAQSWDEELLAAVGSAVGEEMELFDVTLWLAPGMNIHRDPLCGRNFEYYSEDPLIAGKMAAAITRGVQTHPGCGTTIKHFACNNQEDNRMGSDSVLSERALREIYLRGFGIAIREGRPMSLMTSYNLVNGVHAANNYDLCTLAARREFGFDGMIMTDWGTTEMGDDCTAAGCMRAGNDLVMPGNVTDPESIRAALADGSLTLETLRGCITRLVRVILRSNRYEAE